MAQYKQSPYRIINLVVYILAALVNSLPAHTFSSINSSVEITFNYSKQTVTANALIFTILHPIGAFPTNWILDKYGSRIGCIIGSVFVIAGVWLRTLMQRDQPFFCLVGSFFAAFGNLFVLNSAVKVAVNWFNQANVPNVIFLAVLANQISMTFGASAPGLILGNNPSIQEIKSIVFYQAIIISVPLIFMIILYKDKPQSPPSKAASKTPRKQKYSTLLKRLFSNKQYMKILVAMMFSYGTMIAFIANLDQMLKSLSYKDSNQVTANTVLYAMLFGMVATPFFSILLKKTRRYKYITFGNILGCYVFMGVLVYVYAEGVDNYWLIAILAGLAGVFLIPNVSLYIAYSAETAFPIGEGSAGGYLFAAGQTFGFVLGVVIMAVLDKTRGPALWSFITFQALIAMALVFISWTKEDLKRQKYEQNLRKSSINGQIETSNHLEDSLIIPQSQTNSQD